MNKYFINMVKPCWSRNFGDLEMRRSDGRLVGVPCEGLRGCSTLLVPGVYFVAMMVINHDLMMKKTKAETNLVETHKNRPHIRVFSTPNNFLFLCNHFLCLQPKHLKSDSTDWFFDNWEPEAMTIMTCVTPDNIRKSCKPGIFLYVKKFNQSFLRKQGFFSNLVVCSAV